MKANIVIAKPPMDQAGDYMLPRMLLHPVESLLPVDSACHRSSGIQRRCRRVEDHIFPLLNIQHFDVIQIAGIGILAAPFREKGGAIQHHLILVFYRTAVQHLCLKFLPMAVIII